MQPNPFLGVALHALGGLMSATFYVPYRGVRGWAWESFWLAGGIFSWVLAPWLLAALTVPHLFVVLREAPTSSLVWCYIFGMAWGFGGLTFGLTMRYLGLSLGNAVALGFCAAFGTLMPPIFAGTIDSVLKTNAGHIVLAGVAVCLSGIVGSGLAGISKERELSGEKKKETIAEFNLTKGTIVAVFCGIMSAAMAYGIAAGEPIAELAVKHGTPDLWKNTPVFVVILLGGLTTNLIWCVILHFRNRSAGDYTNRQTPLIHNYLLVALGGTIWYMQFMFYGMGTTKMGKYGFSSWTLHMASIMIFGTIWGFALGEWKSASRRTLMLVALGLAALVASTIIVGYGNYLGTKSG
jgi:L-rhamnose-H+ transport protein